LKYLILITALVITCCLLSCKPAVTTGQVLKGYDITSPEKFFMPESLHEISGISFYKNNSDTVYAIQDEEGKLFRLAWDKKKQYHSKFGKKGDYEDLAIISEAVFILKSNGHLFTFPFSEHIFEEPDSVSEWKHLLPAGEYESLYGDEATGKLYLLCKNCPVDNAAERVTGYILQTGDSVYNAGTFEINVRDLKSFTGKVNHGFRPSALARNTVTHDWYILSAVNRMLVVADSSWKVKEVCALNASTFNQPEGIAFDPAGNMYICNEGDDFSEGNILKFTSNLTRPHP
jgi:hypothetical protein